MAAGAHTLRREEQATLSVRNHALAALMERAVKDEVPLAGKCNDCCNCMRAHGRGARFKHNTSPELLLSEGNYVSDAEYAAAQGFSSRLL